MMGFKTATFSRENTFNFNAVGTIGISTRRGEITMNVRLLLTDH